MIDYESQYFDTADFLFYLHHHNGTRTRYKVRYRKYSEPEVTYFEIKYKNNKERTRKRRIKVPTIGVMNALSTPDISLLELLFANGAIVLVAFSMELFWRKTTLNEVLVIYEKIENIKTFPANLNWNSTRKYGPEIIFPHLRNPSPRLACFTTSINILTLL